MSNIAPEHIGSAYDPANSYSSDKDSDYDLIRPHRTRGLRVLVLDQSAPVRKACCEIAGILEFTTTEAETQEAAREILNRNKTAVLLLDMTLPNNGSRALLKDVRDLYPEISIIAMSASASMADAVETMRIGACDYLSKPFPLDVLFEALNRAASRWHFNVERRRLQEELRPETKMADALGRAVEMEKLYRTLSYVADSTHPVMILGESGTGKALVAQSIHSNGRYSSKPFVSLDCTSLGPALLEEALFGNTESSFATTTMQKSGLLISNKGGTIFLDEIGDMPLDLQGRLMKALRDKEILRAGGAKAVRTSVRVLAATSRDLMQMVKEGLFRADLYRLLSVVNLRIPPLRGRPDDIAFLAKRFLEKIRRRTGLTRTLTKEALEILESYDWPDNVRELEDTILRACSQASGPKLEPMHLPRKVLLFHRTAPRAQAQNPSFYKDADRPSDGRGIIPIAKMEKRAILKAMQETDGDKLKAAKLLGIGKTTLYRKLREYGFSDASSSIAALPSSVASANDAKDTLPITSCA